MSRLRPIDIFQIATSALLLALGTATMVHAAMHQAWYGVFIGAVMVAYAVYRWSAILKAFREVKR